MTEVPELDPDIDRYYSSEWDEDARLRSGLNELEYVRTQELIRRYVPAGVPLRILDVGGGSGVHAEWLIGDGHEVVLVDPVERHVRHANQSIDSDRFTALNGDARSIDFDDAEFDVVLFLGPLYHLTNAADRDRAWGEAVRVVKPQGLVIAAGITQFASLFAGLEKDEIFVDEFRAIVEQDLVDGQHRNHPDRDYFTTAFFHHPAALVEEAEAAGLVDIELFTVEGPIGAMPHLEEAWNDPAKRQTILDLIRRVEQEPTLMGIGPHVLVAGRKA